MPELGINEVLMGANGFAKLFFLGAMCYAGLIFVKRRGGVWSQLLAWGTLVNLVIWSVVLGASFAVYYLVVSTSESSLLSKLPISVEAWTTIGLVAGVVTGALTLVTGIALVFLGWHEGKLPQRGRKKRKR